MKDNTTKKAKISIFRIISDILILILLIVVAVSGYNLFKIFSEYQAGTSEYDRTADQYVETMDASAETSSEDEDSAIVCPISVDFDSLLSENSDVIGWIYSENTQINYPVLQGKDNDQYLHTMINGQYNSSGSIFMDYADDASLNGFKAVLYGHHMKNGSMFASLRQYRTQEFYDEHTTMWYLTPTQTYRLDVIAGYIGEDSSIIYAPFYDQETLDQYLEFALSRTTFTANQIPENIDKILVLSTCSYETEDARYVVVTVPVPVE